MRRDASRQNFRIDYVFADRIAVEHTQRIADCLDRHAIERAAGDPGYAAWQETKLRGLFMTGAGNSGNAASRVEEFVQSKGGYAYGGYPDIDQIFHEQAGERDLKKREALLHKIQQLTIDRAMYAPVMDLRTLNGIGPRVAKHTITDVWMSPFPSYEDIELNN